MIRRKYGESEDAFSSAEDLWSVRDEPCDVGRWIDARMGMCWSVRGA